jgi:excisionase family DNA binding protein
VTLTSVDLFTLPGPFRVADVAAAIGCSTQYLYNCIDAGAIRVGHVGEHYRIPAAEARRLALEAGHEPPPGRSSA